MGHQRLPRRSLGHTDMVVTALGFGGIGLGGLRTTAGDALGAATVLRAWERGINYVDAAPEYVANERRIGLAFNQTTGKPSDLYISTGTTLDPRPNGRSCAEMARSAVEASLDRLGVSSVDLLMVHARGSLEPLLAPGGLLDALEQQRAAGTLRWIGYAGRDHARLRQAIRCGRFQAILTSADYNLVRQSAAPLIAEAAAAGVGVVVAEPLLCGLLAGDEPNATPDGAGPHTTYVPSDDMAPAHQWWLWSRERGISLLALALQYAMRHPWIDTVLAGADSPAQVDQILEAVAEDIDERVWGEVEDRVGQLHVSKV